MTCLFLLKLKYNPIVDNMFELNKNTQTIFNLMLQQMTIFVHK
jgi:hypothetical protein